jgi:hypothetical protein
MKRFLASALLLSAVSGFGLVGCGETEKVEVEKKVSGPSGTTVEKDTSSVKTTGDGGASGATTTTTTVK